MLHKLIPAALIAAVLATPAMACTDWGAVAAFDAVITAHAQRDVEDMDRGFEKILNAGNKLSAEQVNISTQMYAHRNKVDMEVETDRDNALADKCQDDAQ
jgi:hypothetical protein